MDPNGQIIKNATDRAFARYIPAQLDSVAARVLMYAITRQESNWVYRDQLEAGGQNTVLGPALGLGQFELGGGVKGVMSHPATQMMAKAAVAAAGVQWSQRAVWVALKSDDALAMAFVRLLLYTDAAPLPAVGAEGAAFEYYLRNWRPGAWYNGTAAQRADVRKRWSRSYADAMQLIQQG